MIAMRLAGLAVLLGASVSQAYGSVSVSPTATTTQSSGASTGASGRSSTQSSVNSSNVSASAESTNVARQSMSLMVLGSALLLGVAGGIVTTVYSNAAAQRRAEEFRKLHPPQLQPPRPAEPASPPPPGELPPPPTELTPPPPPPQVKVDPPIDAMVMARSWLLANELQLKQDLALGAGPAIDDLAGIAAIAPANRAHFGKVLQRNRAVLIAPPEVTPRQAAELMARVGDLVMADPVLRADGELAVVAPRCVAECGP